MNRAFCVARDSAWHRLHPLTKLIVAASLITLGFFARWPHTPNALFVCGVLPLAWWAHLTRELVRATLIVIAPFAISITLIQGFFYPGAHTLLLTVGPLSLKAEGLWFAYLTTSKALLLTSAGLLLLLATHPVDLMLALTECGLPRALAYVMMTALQLIPQLQARITAILDAQRARGLVVEGHIITRARALAPLVAPLVYGALLEVDERAMALEARGFAAQRKKTSFIVLPDTRAQRSARWLLGISLSIVCIGMVLAQ